MLEWPKTAADSASTGPDATVEVLRTAQTPDSDYGNTPNKVVSSGNPPKKSFSDPFSRTQRKDKAAYVHFRQGSPSSQTSQPEPPTPQQYDGMVDRSAAQGMVYLYTAQRVQVLTPGGKTIEIRSEPTAPTTITMRDTFPPAPPKGLVSIPGTAARPGQTGTIDLAWEPNTETDLAGYFVYRTDLAEASSTGVKPTQMNASPIPASTYRDTSALSGHRYVYRVVAVDRNGNVSSLSLPVEDSPEVR